MQNIIIDTCRPRVILTPFPETPLGVPRLDRILGLQDTKSVGLVRSRSQTCSLMIERNVIRNIRQPQQGQKKGMYFFSNFADSSYHCGVSIQHARQTRILRKTIRRSSSSMQAQHTKDACLCAQISRLNFRLQCISRCLTASAQCLQTPSNQ